MKSVISVVCLLAFCCLAAGCETTRGLGKDMENTGANVQKGVDKIYHPSGE
jgi:predicted small secreted protein